MAAEVLHFGGCHCGAVRYQVYAPENITAFECNCSVCKKKGNIHFIVPGSKFKLLQGEDSLTTYRFNTGQAKHTFCKICGVQSFYTPRSNPDGFGVAPHCLDDGTMKSLTIQRYDGQNWEKSYEETGVAALSKEQQ